MRDLTARPDLEHYRREAKELVRAHRAGDEHVRARAADVLGDRDRFVLADAQALVAREHGFRTWAELRRAVEERGERVVDSGLAYGDGEPILVLVRTRPGRHLLSDRGRAVEKAGRPPGWREAAERAVEPMNLDRRGAVFVPAVAGRDLDDLVVRLADASRAVHEAVLVLVD
jgi:hypothetical protein